MNNQNSQENCIVNTLDYLIECINTKPRRQAKVWITDSLYNILTKSNNKSTLDRIPRINDENVNWRVCRDNRGSFIKYVIYDTGYETPDDYDLVDI